MAQRQCFHCKEWIDSDEPHDCWTTTEAALTRELSEDLQDAYERLRESAASLGDQRIYASHHCIMFSRTACYFFVRPKRNALEICIFLGRPLNAPQVRRVAPSSKTKFANILHIKHRDEVEPPITDWLREAYDLSDALSARTQQPRPKAVKHSVKATKDRTGAKGAKGATNTKNTRKIKQTKKAKKTTKPIIAGRSDKRRSSGRSA